MTATPKLGLFGGAFDPPHNAHVALARAAVEQLALDRLHILPTGHAWHKQRGLTAAAHRLAMAREAFGSIPGVFIDERELHRPGATYTVDTLHELAAEEPTAEWHLVMGEDQAAGFSGWRDWEEVARLAVLCVAQRGDDAEQGLEHLQALPGVRVRPLVLPRMAESATDIRARLTAGRDIAQLVPAGVARYIDHHRLYRTA